jgi:[acyl-carrier-protein] S-malonyltransferase
VTIVAMFPGQSSRYPEMLEKLAAEPVCAAVLREASEILGRDARVLDLSRNRDVQLGVFLANHLHLTLLQDAGVELAWSLGLSLGEYNHLVHIGALRFADALPLIEARGRLYDEATGGLMVSVFPLEAEVIEQQIFRRSLGDRVGIGLYNSPRQQVISGERGAVEELLAALEADEYFDATVIEPRIPMHAPWFAPTAARFAEILAATPFALPERAYVPNVVGDVLSPTIAQIRACLTAHVHQPVRWRASIEAVARRVAAPWFVEIGPRAVLHNLFAKDWMPGRRAKTDAAENWRAHFAALAKELRDVA